MDTRSSVKADQWTTDTPPLSSVLGPPQATPPRGGQPDVVDVEAHPDPVILGDAMIEAAMAGATNLGDTTIEAATDVVNCTSSPQMTLAKRRLKHFTERIRKRRQPPLLELPRDDTAYGRYAPPTLPTRSKQIVT